MVTAWAGLGGPCAIPSLAGPNNGIKFEYDVRVELGATPKSKRVVRKSGECVAGMQEKNSAGQEPQCVWAKSLPNMADRKESHVARVPTSQATTFAVVVNIQAVAAARGEREARISNQESVLVGVMKALRNSAQSRKVRAAGPDPSPVRSAPGRQHPRCPRHCPCQQWQVSTA